MRKELFLSNDKMRFGFNVIVPVIVVIINKTAANFDSPEEENLQQKPGMGRNALPASCRFLVNRDVCSGRYFLDCILSCYDL